MGYVGLVNGMSSWARHRW